MILGLDLYGTLDKHPTKLRELVYAVKDAGGEVHVISAVKPGNEAKARRDAAKYHLPLDGVSVVTCDNYYQAPIKKHAVCVELGITMMIDDRQDIASYLNKRHVLTLVIA